LGGILALFITGCASTPEPQPEPVAEPEPVSEPAPAPVEEPEIVIKPSAPETYIVVKGDTLWDISSKFLRDPWYWPEIWYENPQIANPHLIFPGDVITLYYVGGKPRLAVNGGPRVEGLPSNKLEPQIRREAIDTDDLVIPIQAIQSFLIRPDVLDKQTIDNAPYIFGTQEGRLIYGTGYTVYAHNMPDAKVGDQYDVYHPNKELRDPQTGELLGIETLYAGSAEVTRSGEPATLLLTKMLREGLPKDILLPVDQVDQDRNFYPHAPDEGTEGKIVSLHKALVQVGQYQVAVIDLGANDNIEKGHVFVVYSRGSKIREEGGRTTQLPDEKSGLMMIFRVMDDVSYGLVMDSVRPMKINDIVKAP
jgi:hypothetical protein